MSENSRGSTDEQATSYPGSGCVGGDDRVVIAGSRSFWSDISLVEDPPRYVGQVIRSLGWSIDTVLSGTADGADTAGERWAESVGLPVERHPADWDEHGKAAGPIRNQQMAEQADKVLVLWDGESPGSKSMIDCARDELGRENVHVHRYREESPDDSGGDDDDADDGDELPDDPTELEPIHIDGVGDTIADRLDSVLGITTVAGVADASIESLTQIPTVGQTRAGRAKGRAQGMVKRYERRLHPDDAEEDAMTDEGSPTGGDSADGNPVRRGRVAVVIGDDQLTDVDPGVARQALHEVLETANVELGEDTTLGHVQDYSDFSENPIGNMGGNLISRAVEVLQSRGTLIDKHAFETPWDKYAHFFWQDWGYDEAPDGEKPSLSSIPFNVAREADVEPKMAPGERDQAMVAWAHHVVVIDGAYTGRVMTECNKCRTDADVFNVDCSDGAVTVTRKRDDSSGESGPDIDEQDTIAGRSGTKLERDGVDDDGRAVYTEVEVDEQDWAESKEYRPGSQQEMDTTELETGVQTRDEEWDDDDFEDGTGVGSASSTTGAWY